MSALDSHNILLVGAGAIGTAVIRILAAMPTVGHLTVIDPEHFGIENFGTYSIGAYRESREGPRKIDLAASHAARPDFSFEPMSVEQYLQHLEETEMAWPDTVLLAVDSPEARWASQRLWPRSLIDMSTGDSAVTLRDGSGTSGEPCIECMLPRLRSDTSALTTLAEVSGLDPHLLASGGILGEDDLTGLADDKRGALLPHLGKPVCGLAAAFGLSELPSDGYRPAVPFVAQQAACLGVGRLIARLGGATGLPNQFQYDVFVGPQRVSGHHLRPTPGCRCQRRAEVIRQLQVERGLI